MGRTPKPWWREERQAYYATVDGVCHRLGTSKKAADDELKRLLKTPGARPVASDTMDALIDDFLVWTQENRAEKTYRGYKDFLDTFLGENPRLRTCDLTANHVETWLSKAKTWNSTTKRNAITALQRALNWAKKNRGLKVNPIAGMEKPKATSRVEAITLAEFKAILRQVKDRSFRDLLLFSWDCGCRPQEARALCKRHVDLPKGRCVFPVDEAKGKKRPRVIYLATSRAIRIVTRKTTESDGVLFLNKRGRPWTASAVKCRFAAMEKEIGKRYHQYSFRHSWITRKLQAGVDSHVVAALSGHVDTKMIDKVYSHVAEDHDFMLKEAGKN